MKPTKLYIYYIIAAAAAAAAAAAITIVNTSCSEFVFGIK